MRSTNQIEKAQKGQDGGLSADIWVGPICPDCQYSGMKREPLPRALLTTETRVVTLSPRASPLSLPSVPCNIASRPDELFTNLAHVLLSRLSCSPR